MKQPKTYIDPTGAVVPSKYVKSYDKERDRIAHRILDRWLKAEQALRRVKRDTLADIDRLQELAEKSTGVTLGGKKGNVQFRNFSGDITVALDIAHRTEFDERLQIAQGLIMEAVQEMAGEETNHDLVEIATRAFQPRSSGRLDMQRIRDLRTYNVRHPKWRQACDIIADCERTIGARQYIRVSRRASPDMKPEAILLDMAAITIDEVSS